MMTVIGVIVDVSGPCRSNIVGERGANVMLNEWRDSRKELLTERCLASDSRNQKTDSPIQPIGPGAWCRRRVDAMATAVAMAESSRGGQATSGVSWGRQE